MPRFLTGVCYLNSSNNVPVFNGMSIESAYEWIDQKYRTITFLEKPTGDLLTWLQANAVKQ